MSSGGIGWKTEHLHGATDVLVFKLSEVSDVDKQRDPILHERSIEQWSSTASPRQQGSHRFVFRDHPRRARNSAAKNSAIPRKQSTRIGISAIFAKFAVSFPCMASRILKEHKIPGRRVVRFRKSSLLRLGSLESSQISPYHFQTRHRRFSAWWRNDSVECIPPRRFEWSTSIPSRALPWSFSKPKSLR